MEMNLVKQELDMQQEKKLFKDKGYIILKNFFDKEYINNLKTQAEEIFKIQFRNLNYSGSFKENMIRLFNE